MAPLQRIVAVVDVGSNSVRLLVARQLSDSAFEVVDEERFPARLGMGQAADGYLSDAGIGRGVRALRICTEVAASYGPSTMIAAGTEALRRAPNAGVFTEAVFQETGVRVRILTAEEEAYASFLGAVNSTDLRDGYIVDIGGGSLEIITVEGRALVRSKSVPFGALYAAERFKSDPPSPKDVRALRKAVRQAVGPMPRRGPVVGVGGAVRNLARIQRLKVRYPLRRLHGLALPRRDLHRLAASLTRTDADGRRRIAGLSANRVDSLHAAAVVLDEVLDVSGAPEFMVSGQGLREGLVWQELRGGHPILPDVRGASIAGLAEANGVPVFGAEPVVGVAARLFAATQGIHGYGAPELDLLLSGARLAGIGMHVDYYSRDRHAEYLVHSGDLHGFTHREIVLLGALVRGAEGGGFSLSEYARVLSPGDERRVEVLSALLGTARAVRRRTPSPVLDYDVRVGTTGIVVVLRGSAPLDAEVYAFEMKQRALAAALEVPVRLVVDDSP
ncbi:MAG: hypothetical protein ACKVVT_18220 [Dehalococcoidia bacterium]